MRVTLLGGFNVSVDGTRVKVGAAERRLIVLTALRPRPHSRAEVADLLWPHLDTETARASLRTALSRLRTTVPSLLDSDAHLLQLADRVRVDAWEVEEIASRLIGAESPRDNVSVDMLTAQLLPDWHDDWVVFERDRLHDVCMHAIEVHASLLAAAGRFAEAILAICEALRVDPLCESAARTLVEIHLAAGNRGRAARAYLQFRERSLSRLGMEPSEDFQTLMRPLLKRSPSGGSQTG